MAKLKMQSFFSDHGWPEIQYDQQLMTVAGKQINMTRGVNGGWAEWASFGRIEGATR